MRYLSSIRLCAFVTVVTCASVFFTCKDEPTKPPPPEAPTPRIRVILSGELLNYTEAELRIAVQEKDSIYTCALERNGTRLASFTLWNQDTVMVDRGLDPSMVYRYRVNVLKNGQPIDSSNTIELTTSDTTTHDFIWTITRFGVGQSWLKDVAAISPDNIWVVGTIGLSDSAGSIPPSRRYNAAHWDGVQWTYYKVIFQANYGEKPYPSFDQQTVQSVLAVSENEIWFSGLNATRLINNTWEYFVNTWPVPVEYGISATKMFAFDRNNVFLVCSKDYVTHWDGTRFSKIDSKISTNFNDVWGVGDTVLCVASNWDEPNNESTVLRIVNRRATFFPNNGLPRGLASIWFKRQNNIYSFGGNFSHWDGTKWSQAWQPSFGPGLIHGMRGEAENDLFCVGDLGTISHFNGRTWKWFDEINQTRDYLFNSLATLPDRVYAVGSDRRGKGLLIHGRRKK